MEELAANDTCVAPVLSIPEVVENEHWRARGVFMQAEHPEDGRFDQVSPILAGGHRDHPVHSVRVDDATDTRALLAEAGLSEGEVDKLLEEGAVE